MEPMKLAFSGLLALLLSTGAVQAEEKIKPFVQAESQGAGMAEAVSTAKQALRDAGFEVVGEYSPYDNATIVAITSDELKATAAKTDYGVFGAAQRVTFYDTGDAVQVAYTNPVYLAHAYRLDGDLVAVASQLEGALGKQQSYGSKKGLSGEDLRDYQYKWLMPYFYDRLSLASYDSYQEAVNSVEAAIAEGKGGVKPVYRIDLPDQEATVFGVNILGNSDDTECAGDQYIMERIDFKEIKSLGHLPYEIVVKDNKAYALRAEFRIAISFPDLSMMGSNSFASIMCAPSAIEAALTRAAGGKTGGDDW
ncbi:hypothetical protein [Thiohalophilus thiocyanatoxydans]|uniref:Uncharacterized protein n=1 Tax=Thiohalophilus thiocyanatoxydans TaxID=381308 RepID=A0A4R8IMM2_9GAMM|nr:hypothetical protein [Thiohalophilus thiocyanatoxydans]TDY01688.1 hypothetical protein EDC23_1578 [Thiohalophilus thiocyanatoxydans]